MKTNFNALQTAFNLTREFEKCNTYGDVLKVLIDNGIIFDTNTDMTAENPWRHCITVTRTSNPELEELAPDDEDWEYLSDYAGDFNEEVDFELKYYPEYPYKLMTIEIFVTGGWEYQKVIKLDPDYYGPTAVMKITELWGTDDIRVKDIFIIRE